LASIIPDLGLCCLTTDQTCGADRGLSYATVEECHIRQGKVSGFKVLAANSLLAASAVIRRGKDRIAS